MLPTTLSASHPSPKRKRDPPPPIPLLNTTLRTASTPPRDSPAPDSPRNEVADQLRGMSLTSIAEIPLSPLSPADDLVRKKPKLEERRVDSGTSLDAHFAEAKAKTRKDEGMLDSMAVNMAKSDSRETPETPQAHVQPRTFSETSKISFAHPTAFVSSSTNTASQSLAASNSGTTYKDRTSQPRKERKSPSPSLTALTWQDSEITGHLAGPGTDPDDDGTGLNGIGFRPTPAIAHARAQKRRQQVMDWKARETREARAKRSERRRRGIGGASSRETTVEREIRPVCEPVTARTVKFAI